MSMAKNSFRVFVRVVAAFRRGASVPGLGSAGKSYFPFLGSPSLVFASRSVCSMFRLGC